MGPSNDKELHDRVELSPLTNPEREKVVPSAEIVGSETTVPAGSIFGNTTDVPFRIKNESFLVTAGVGL